jgi:hypothetical protein
LVAIFLFSNVKSINITHFLLQAGNWCQSAASFVLFLILIHILYISDCSSNWVFCVLAVGWYLLGELIYFFLFILQISHFLMLLFIIFLLLLIFNLILALNKII